VYRLFDKDANYYNELTSNLEVSKVNTTTKIIKGLKFLALKGNNRISAKENEIIVYVEDDCTFCDADVLYLEKHSWVAIPDEIPSFVFELD